MTDTAGMTDGVGLTDTTPFFGDTVLILDIPEETFQNAPGIDENLDLTDSTGIGGIETFYRDLGEDVIGRPIAETDLEAVTGNAVKLSDIQGSNVQNPAGEGVGEVNDMLINLREGHVEYFILEFGGFLGIGDSEYAIPMDAFDVIPTAADVADGFPTLVLDVTEEQLETAPVFDADTLGNPDWDLDSRDFWVPGN
jgi:sporulation protein YlmC with PRC-barrel domain